MIKEREKQYISPKLDVINLTEEEISDIVSQVIKEVRAEKREKLANSYRY